MFKIFSIFKSQPLNYYKLLVGTSLDDPLRFFHDLVGPVCIYWLEYSMKRSNMVLGTA